MSSGFYKLIDIAFGSCYYLLMSNQLTISQVKEIMGWSYPTALNYAKAVGTIDRTIPPSGLWTVPADCVKAVIDEDMAAVAARLERLQAIVAE